LKSNIQRNSNSRLPATNSGLRPGDFPVGSVESRAAARALAEHRQSHEGGMTTIHSIPSPNVDNSLVHITEWHPGANGSLRYRWVYVPSDLKWPDIPADRICQKPGCCDVKDKQGGIIRYSINIPD
jgi:hypothetical protein